MICTKCGEAIIIGPGGCACTRAARHDRKMKEVVKRGEELAAMLKKKMGEIPAEGFLPEAIEQILASGCDFQVDLFQEAQKVAAREKAKAVTRAHVEKAAKKLRRNS